MTPEEKQKYLPFDQEIQYHILKMMTISEHLLAKCSLYLKKDYFEDSILGWFFDTILQHYEQFGRPIEIITLKNELLKFSQDKRFVYERVLEKIEASHYRDEEYLRKELTGWLRSRMFIKLHTKVASLFNENQRENAYDITLNAINEIKQIDFIADKVIDFSSIETLIDAVSNSQDRRIPIGIPEFDSAMLGGLPRQTLTTILGGTNVGKSLMLINLTYNAMINDKKVLYIYHEGQDEQTSLRFLSRFTGIPYMKFYNGQSALDSTEQQRLIAAKALFGKNLVLKPWHGFDVTIEDFIAYCKQKKADFDFDMIVCDYGQLLCTKNAAKELRHNQALIYRGLVALAEELEVAVVSAAQGNRAAQIDTAKGRKLFSITDVSECFDIIRCSECVITLTKSKEDEQNNRMKILLAKQRDGATNVAVDCVTDLKRIVLYDRRIGIYPLTVGENQEITSNDENDYTGSNQLNSSVSH